MEQRGEKPGVCLGRALPFCVLLKFSSTAGTGMPGTVEEDWWSGGGATARRDTAREGASRLQTPPWPAHWAARISRDHYRPSWRKELKHERLMLWKRRQRCSSWPSRLAYDPNVRQCWVPKPWNPKAERSTCSPPFPVRPPLSQLKTLYWRLSIFSLQQYTWHLLFTCIICSSNVDENP